MLANTSMLNNLTKFLKASPQDRVFDFPAGILQTHPFAARWLRRSAGPLLFFRWASVRQPPARWSLPPWFRRTIRTRL